MTTQEMIDELTLSMGNRTDIAAARYVLWLNWALYDLCGFHRKRLLPSLRFRVLEGKFMMTVPVVTGTSTGGTSTTIILAVGSSAVDDYYNDMVIELSDSQIAIITDYDAGTLTATVDVAWTTTPTTETYSIYMREVNINTYANVDPHDVMWAIEKLETLRGTDIVKKEWMELVGIDITAATGDIPDTYARRGDTLLFSIAIDTALSLRGWYYKFPTVLDVATPTVECILPEYWHEVIVLGAVYRGFEKLMEPERAAEAKGQYVDEAANRVTQAQMEATTIDWHVKHRSYLETQ